MQHSVLRATCVRSVKRVLVSSVQRVLASSVKRVFARACCTGSAVGRRAVEHRKRRNRFPEHRHLRALGLQQLARSRTLAGSRREAWRKVLGAVGHWGGCGGGEFGRGEMERGTTCTAV